MAWYCKMPRVTVEYQKHGLPHIHLLLFLDCLSHLSTPETINKVISTKIPDEAAQPWLFTLIKQFMIHGLCSPRLVSPCMDEHVLCTKNFPKPFQECTEITDDSFVLTHWHDNRHFIQVGNEFVDNHFVVSYCPYLTLHYQAHINTECTAGFHAIKYVYKVMFFFTLPHTHPLSYTDWHNPVCIQGSCMHICNSASCIWSR